MLEIVFVTTLPVPAELSLPREEPQAAMAASAW